MIRVTKEQRALLLDFARSADAIFQVRGAPPHLRCTPIVEAFFNEHEVLLEISDAAKPLRAGLALQGMHNMDCDCPACVFDRAFAKLGD